MFVIKVCYIPLLSTRIVSHLIHMILTSKTQYISVDIKANSILGSDPLIHGEVCKELHQNTFYIHSPKTK